MPRAASVSKNPELMIMPEPEGEEWGSQCDQHKSGGASVINIGVGEPV